MSHDVAVSVAPVSAGGQVNFWKTGCPMVQKAGVLTKHSTSGAGVYSNISEMLTGFDQIGWTDRSKLNVNAPASHLYVFLITRDRLTFPLYIGQTRRLRGRIGDYESANFAASTDFRVGTCIPYLERQGCSVTLLYRASSGGLQDERQLIRNVLLNGYLLLNFLSGFDYGSAEKTVEAAVLYRFCDMLLDQSNIRARV